MGEGLCTTRTWTAPAGLASRPASGSVGTACSVAVLPLCESAGSVNLWVARGGEPGSLGPGRSEGHVTPSLAAWEGPQHRGMPVRVLTVPAVSSGSDRRIEGHDRGAPVMADHSRQAP